MKRTGFICLAASLLFAGCQSNTDNNKSLDFDELEVNFTVKTGGIELPAGAQFAVCGLCTRGGEENVNMGTGAVTRYRVAAAGTQAALVKESEADAIVARSDDHNFRFFAVSPAVEAIGETIAVNVPSVQEYSAGVESYISLWAAKKVTTVIPDIEFELQTPAAVLNLLVPTDIVEENVPATLKSLEISPADETASVILAGGGSLNLESGEFTPVSSGQSSTLTVNFPEGGLKLEAAKTGVEIAVLPFTVPKGGFNLKFTDVDGKSSETLFLAQESDEGKTIEAGTVTDITVSASGDGIEPVTFPVQFPISKVDGKQNVTEALQPRWKTEGYWSCISQPQAYCQWHQVSVPQQPDGYKQFFEIVNSGNISTLGVKGVWTGDCFEFVIPVKNFAAGTKIEFNAPFYGRQEPVFWYIKYLDGEEWKTCNLHDETCYDGKTSMECTFSLVRGTKTITEVMTFGNAIKSGYLKVRIECADGAIQADTMTSVATREYPFYDAGKKYAAPFYFWDNADASGGASTGSAPKITAVSFSIVD